MVVSKRCKLDCKMGYMVIRADETTRIFLDEIALLIIENPAVSLTGCLLEKLNEKKIRVVFCDSKRSPYAELAPYHGSFDCARKVKLQASWQADLKGVIWQAIIAEKISKQAQHLADCGHYKEALLLESYIPEVEPHDATNREGHAAKVYFNALFGMDFKRSDDKLPANMALNYGYSILLSAFNRAITSCGYLTQAGIHHDNIYNHYNLSSDIMEPFRVLTDRMVMLIYTQDFIFDKDARYRMVDILNEKVLICGNTQTVLNSIDIYVRSFFRAMNDGCPAEISFYTI